MIIFLPATFKVIIGTEQIWLMVELVVQINRAARILNYPEEEEGLSSGVLSEYGLEDQSAYSHENKLLSRGRIIVTVINCSYLALVIALCYAISPPFDH